MTDYIVDTSIVVQFLITDTYTQNTRALFQSLTRGDSIHVPEFCYLECTNVLWKEVRFNRMLPADAEAQIKSLRALPLHIVNIESLLERTLQIGLQHQLAVYDSAYITLAEKLYFPLITADTRQETAARSLGVTIKPITAFS